LEVIETAPKWHDIAENNIEKEDSLEKSYEGKIDGKTGYLLLSRRKLLFVREEGFFRKAYNLTLDLPYDEISTISDKARFKMEFIDKNGEKHDFESYAVLASKIKEDINKLQPATSL